MAQHDLGNLDQAVTVYSEAIAIEQEDINPYTNRAIVYTTLAKYNLAADDMDRVFEINPTYAKGYLVRANAYAKLGMKAQSQADIDQAVALGIDRAKAETSIAELAPSP